jgi:hypothetical protein
MPTTKNLTQRITRNLSRRIFRSEQIHDGIGLDFVRNFFYTKAPNQPIKVADLASIFTVTRNSSATMRGGSGTLEYANENLCLQSQTFDNATWQAQQVTVTANAAIAPDGTLTADRLTEQAINSTHNVFQPITVRPNAPYTFSVYVKAGERTSVVIYWAHAVAGFESLGAQLNMLTGALTQANQNAPYFSGPISATNVGNGWWRLSVSGIFNNLGDTNGGVTIRFVREDDVSTAYQGDTSKGLYVWGAQFQSGLVLKDYIPTTTVAKFDQPRYEFNTTTTGMNRLLQSETFDNASWIKSGSTVTANAAFAPTGALVADKLVESSGGTFHLIRQDCTTTLGVANTFSISAAPAGRQVIRLQLTNQAESNGSFVDVDLYSGVASSVTNVGSGSAGTVSVTAQANGFWRISLKSVIDTTSTLARCQVLLSSGGTTNFSGDGASGVYLYGAQYELGSTATTYTVTTTVAPRFTNSAPSPLGLRFDPSRTNVALQSQELDNVAWTKSNCTITANSTTLLAPDRTPTMDTVVEDATLNIHGVVAGMTVTAGATYCLSAYVRPAGRTMVFMYGINVDQYGAIFDLVGGTAANITSGVGTVTDKGIINLGDGIYRVWVSGVLNGAATTLNFVAGPAISTAVPAGYTYTGDGASGIQMWGIQVELGNSPSSYIHTSSTSVTRAADLAVRTFGAEYSATEGTAYMEFMPDNLTDSGIIFAMGSDGRHGYMAASGSAASFDGTNIVTGGTTVARAINKFAHTQDVNGQIVALNAAAPVTGSRDAAWGGGTVLSFGARDDGAIPFIGNIRNIQFTPKKSTSAEISKLVL